jgi:hypothetical protein
MERPGKQASERNTESEAGASVAGHSDAVNQAEIEDYDGTQDAPETCNRTMPEAGWAGRRN